MQRLVLEFRLLFYAILGVIVPFGILLYFFPGGTDSYWAWDIPHPRSSILIGAGYLGAIVYYVMLLRQNDWRQTQNGMGGLVVFCLVLLFATLLHWDDFKSYHFTTLVWLMFYYVGPFLVPIVYRLQQSKTPPAVSGSYPGVGNTWRLWLIIRGFFYMTLAIFWFLTAETVSAAWPWPIRALELRVFMGQIAIIGWNAIVILQDRRDWDQLRPGILLSGAIGLVQLIGLLMSTRVYDWSLGLGVFLPVMFFEWLLTPALFWMKFSRTQAKTV